MSQYGAYGAARKGSTGRRSWRSTTRGQRCTSRQRDHDQGLGDRRQRQEPAGPAGAGLAVPRRPDRSYTVPTGARTRPGVSAGPVRATGSATRRAAARTSHQDQAARRRTWSFSTPAKMVKLVLPGGSTREYRGSRALVKRGSGGRTVNKVPAGGLRTRASCRLEMPTSWAANAVRAQAVAARTYAVRLRGRDQLPRLRRLRQRRTARSTRVTP